MEVCVTPRDRGTVRPVAAGRPAQAFQGKAGKAVERGGGKVSGIAQACADTSLPTEVLSATK